MTGEPRRKSIARGWKVFVASLEGVVVAGALIYAALVVVPPAVANLAGKVSDGTTPESLGGASVVVPADWIIVRASPDELTARTPDDALRATVTLSDDTPDDAVADTAKAGVPRSELLASRLTAVHADVGEGIVAGVGRADAAPTVRVEVKLHVPDGGSAEAYRAAVGALLEGIRL